MMARLSRIPADELTAALLDAAFAEVECVATERGVDREGFIAELLFRAVEGLWDDEDREALRGKAHAAVSAYVDALFDGLGDARVAA